MKNIQYYYVACETPDEQKVNPEFKHYFRLYKYDGVAPILVEQGIDLVNEWEAKYKATFNQTNPYPTLD